MDDIYKIGDVIRIISTNEDVNNHIFLIREISRSRNNTEIVLMDQYIIDVQEIISSLQKDLNLYK